MIRNNDNFLFKVSYYLIKVGFCFQTWGKVQRLYMKIMNRKDKFNLFAIQESLN